jgi:hypothetical protein
MMNEEISVEALFRELSDFAASLTNKALDELLQRSSKSEAEKATLCKKHDALQLDLARTRSAWIVYEKSTRCEIKSILDRFLELLDAGPKQKEVLVQQFSVVLEAAGRINCLDDELMDKLADIWPQATRPEVLPAFDGGEPPRLSEWPRYGLKEIFYTKQAEAGDFWLDVYNNMFRLEIAAATEALKKKKEQLDVMVTTMDRCIRVLSVMNRTLGLAAAV